MLERIAAIIQKNLIPFVVLSIVLGLLFGWVFFHASIETTHTGIAVHHALSDDDRVEDRGDNESSKESQTHLIFKHILVISPPLAALLAYIFLRGYPDFAVGLILTGCVPCAGMVAAWTGYAKGNIALTMVIVALSLVISIFTIPLWMSTLAGIYVVVNVIEMFKDILLIVVIPLILGNLTRRYLIEWHEALHRVEGDFPYIHARDVYDCLHFAIESVRVIHNPMYFVVILAPLILFYITIFSSSLLYAVKAGFNYEDSIAFVYSVAGKNISIAIALATVFFSPLTVLILAIKPIILSFMAGFLKLTPTIEERMFKAL